MWKGRNQFVWAQAQVAVILLLAHLGNTWPTSYPRNDNHNPTMFWIMNGVLLVAALATLKTNDSRDGSSVSKQVVPASGSGNNNSNSNPTTTTTTNATTTTQQQKQKQLQLLSRHQTEEWKGWMQFAFIMYHYYRAYFVYNEIRVFVSAYVWMTGFGNFLYFDKRMDFSIDRIVSMWLRINYFPLLLSTFLNVPLELYYVVPLHTVGFFVTMTTCYLSSILQRHHRCTTTTTTSRHHRHCHYMGSSSSASATTPWTSNLIAIGICLCVHVVFYETRLVNSLKFISDEYYFRFQSDKYSAWVGMLCGLLWSKFTDYMQWIYRDDEGDNHEEQHQQQQQASRTLRIQVLLWTQRFVGVFLIWLWWYAFGYMDDKYMYNPIHPYVFWLPIMGFLLLRNSSIYLTQVHSTVLEFFGRITLETYVLQFHLFMCRNVQHIPIVLPGSGADGPMWIKTANMALCGVVFVSTAVWARKVTVTTQMTVVELVDEIRKKLKGGGDDASVDNDDEYNAILDKEKESFLVHDEEQQQEENESPSSSCSAVVVVQKETELVEPRRQADV